MDMFVMDMFVRDYKFYQLLARMTAKHYRENGMKIYTAVVEACSEYGEEFEDSEMAYIKDIAETLYI